MFETVSVDEALKNGKRNVLLPSVAILIGGMFIAITAYAVYHLPGWYAGAGVALSFVLAWLYWGITITRWRLWAFENVRNVHELKKRAIKEQLIWPDGSFFVRTEIRSADDKRRWDALGPKFFKEDVFDDDLTIPAETLIYYSMVRVVIEFVLGLGLLAAAAYFSFWEKNYIAGGIMGVAGIAISFSNFKKIGNKAPQVIINSDGMQADKAPFCKWMHIYNEDVVTERSGKNSYTYLKYTYTTTGTLLKADAFSDDDDDDDFDDQHSDENGGAVKIDIGYLKVSQSELEKLLRVYRGRYEQKAKSRPFA